MREMPAQSERPQSPGEEIANGVSHGIGVIAALVSAPFLMISAVHEGGASAIVGSGVFAGAMLLMYLASTLYHSFPDGKAKVVFQELDHGAIFVLIAGTYTPFTLGVLRGPWGWTLLALVWGLAIFGVAAKAMGRIRHPYLSTGLYLAMGWLILLAIRPLWHQMPLSGIWWLLGGGMAYTTGVVFYAAKRVYFAHFVWHFFVIAGTTCHFFAVLWYA
jgi:hemolysin III